MNGAVQDIPSDTETETLSLFNDSANMSKSDQGKVEVDSEQPLPSSAPQEVVPALDTGETQEQKLKMEQAEDSSHIKAEVDDAEPGDRLEDFDWDAMLQDYKDKLEVLNQKEVDVYDSFSKLVEVGSSFAMGLLGFTDHHSPSVCGPVLYKGMTLTVRRSGTHV